MNIGSLIITMGVNTAGLEAAAVAMKRFEVTSTAMLTRLNVKLVAAGTAMKTFGRTMMMNMSLPLAIVGGAAFAMFKSFDASMAKITGLVGVARSQVNEWRKEVIAMGPALGKAPTELADALFFITSAGIRGQRAMNVLTMAAKASAAGLGETKVIADLVTSAMNAYGPALINAAKATDVLVKTVKEGKAEPAALASSMGMVLPLASQMGVSFNEVGAAMAAMTRTGTGAATAAMQLRQILASIFKPTSMAEDALIKMNTTSQKLRDTITKDGLLKALMDIRVMTKGYSAELAGKVFPNIRALSGVLDLMGKNIEDNVAIFKSLSEATGALDDAFASASATAQHKFNVAIATGKTALTVLGKTVSEAFLPLLASMMRHLAKVTEWFSNLSGANKKLVITIGAVLIALGPVSKLLGFLVGNILPNLIRLLTLTSKAFIGLTAAMLKNPAVILGIAAAAGIIMLTDKLRGFTKATEDATIAQDNFNKVVMDIAEFADLSIIMGFITTLTKQQLGETKARIETQLALEASHTLALKTELSKRLKEDVKLNTLRQQIAKVGSGAIAEQMAAGFSNQISVRKNFIAEDLQLEFEANQKRIKELTNFQNTVIGAQAKLALKTGRKTLITGITVEQQNAVTQMSAKLKILDATFKAYGGTLDLTEERLAVYQEAIQGLIAAGLDPMNTGLQGLITIETLLNKKLEDSKGPLVTMRLALEGVIRKEKELGDAFNGVSERLSIYKRALADGTKENILAGDSIQMLQSKILSLSSMLIKENVAKKLADIAFNQQLMGNSATTAAEQMLVYQNALTMLHTLGLRPGIAIYDEYIKKLEELMTAQKMAIVSAEQMRSMVGSALSGLAASFGEMFADMLKGDFSAGKLFSGLISIVADFLDALGQALIAAALAAEAFQKLFLFPGLGLLAGFAAIATAAIVRGLLVGGPAEMAQGGIVPAGFPNDSFPAMLQSNEAVIPLDRLPGIMNRIGNGKSNETGDELTMVIKGRTLEAIRGEQDKYNNNF